MEKVQKVLPIYVHKNAKEGKNEVLHNFVLVIICDPLSENRPSGAPAPNRVIDTAENPYSC